MFCILLILIVGMSLFLYIKKFKSRLKEEYEKLRYVTLQYKYQLIFLLDIICIILFIDHFFQGDKDAINTIIFGLIISLISSITIDQYKRTKDKDLIELKKIIKQIEDILNELRQFDKSIIDLINIINEISNRIIYSKKKKMNFTNNEKSKLHNGFMNLRKFKGDTRLILQSLEKMKKDANKYIPQGIDRKYVNRGINNVCLYINRIIGKKSGSAYQFYKYYDGSNILRYPNNIFSKDIQFKEIFFIKGTYTDNYRNIYPLTQLLFVISQDSAWSVENLYDIKDRISKFINKMLKQ